MRIAWLIVAIFAGRFFGTAVYYPQGDGDLGWQRWLGGRIAASFSIPQRLGSETFTASGAHWVAQEWLFSLLAYSAGHAWWAVFAGFCALCAAAALSLAALSAVRRGAHPYATALAVIFAGVALFESFGVRVQVLAWPLLAAFLLLLETDGRVAYFAIAVAAVWSNVHASVVLAPVLATVVCAGNLLDRGWDARARRSAFIAALSLLATCANPLGYKIPLYAYMLFSSPFKTMIDEWHRTSLADFSFAAGALPLVLCILAFGVRGPQRWRDRLVLAVFAWLMFSAARNVALFAIAAVPIAAGALTAGIPYLRRRRGPFFTKAVRGAAFFEAAFAISLAAVAAFTVVHDEKADGVRDSQPRAALAAIEALHGPRNVFCADFAWCSFLLGSPRDRVFLDGRADPYPQRVWTDFATIAHVAPKWQQTLRRRGVDVVLVGRTVPLEAALSLCPGWRSVYVDRDFRVWVRAQRTSRELQSRRSRPAGYRAAA
jgi:hypothetical protein